MKRFTILALALLSFGLLSAAQPEKQSVLSSKVVLENTNGYFVLSDGSCWKAVGFSTRWRSLSEWWDGVKLVPQNYECVPNDWYLGALLLVYPKQGNLEVNEADASNFEEIKKCTHLLVNEKSGQVLFAVSLEPEQCILELFKDAEDQGYKKGYSRGRLSAYRDADAIYEEGRAQGYREGYGKGYREASAMRMAD